MVGSGRRDGSSRCLDRGSHRGGFGGWCGWRCRGGGRVIRHLAGMFGLVFSAGLGDSLGHGVQDEPNRADGVIVAGDRVVDEVRVAVGVDDGDDGDVESAGFGDGVMFAFDIDDEHGLRMAVHGADAVQVLLQAGHLAAEHRLLLFDVIIDAAVGFHLLDLAQAGERSLDGLEIGECSTEPTFRDVELGGGGGGLFDGLLGLLLGSDEKDLSALGSDVAQEFASGLQLDGGLAQIDDIDAVPCVENELLHLRVPSAGLVSEVDACFEKFFNSDVTGDAAHADDCSIGYEPGLGFCLGHPEERGI